MKKIIVLTAFFGLLAGCRETRSISSTEVADVNQSADFTVSDDEAARMMAIIRDKIDRGEDLSASLTRIIQIMMTREGPDYAWNPLQIDANRQEQLRARFQTYTRLYKNALDGAGFVKGCDGLLFTSLLAASGLNVDVSPAESDTEPGRWYRSADHNCFPSGQSKSSISRDMMLGLSLALWQKDSKVAVNNIIFYNQEKKGVLGDAIDDAELLGAATMSPSLFSLYSEMDYLLNGRTSETRGYFPEIGEVPLGFPSHLLALRLVMKTALYGGLIENDYNKIAKLAATQPQNALFQAIYHAMTDGDGTAAADILLNEAYFPANALPSTAQRCESYLWQRDQNSTDWQACANKSETFPAVDFFWVYTLLNNTFRR